MSGSAGTGGSNPRKFSEKIALHNQKQAEETRAFEQLMTDLTVSRKPGTLLSSLRFPHVCFLHITQLLMERLLSFIVQVGAFLMKGRSCYCSWSKEHASRTLLVVRELYLQGCYRQRKKA
ncbi:hypothetical protein XENOCAPTIV_030085 [Xenoophorus captivus]|uniref:Transducer of regulated CREB activity N-terminal domain-containing protein n=1 Tax=Xenoophorus captivus TaxID=1517983 RepID=A0ABV0Q7L8_9TELE